MVRVDPNSRSAINLTQRSLEQQLLQHLNDKNIEAVAIDLQAIYEANLVAGEFRATPGEPEIQSADGAALPALTELTTESESPAEATPADMAERLFLAIAASDDLLQGEELRRSQNEQIEKLKTLFTAAVKGGNLDFAVLLFASLEGAQSNQVMTGLMTHMNNLNQQRRDFANQIAQLDPKSPDTTHKLADLQTRVSSVGTDIGMLQTFLQEAAATKRQAEEFASNMLAQSHRTAQSIIQNIGR